MFEIRCMICLCALLLPPCLADAASHGGPVPGGPEWLAEQLSKSAATTDQSAPEELFHTVAWHRPLIPGGELFASGEQLVQFLGSTSGHYQRMRILGMHTGLVRSADGNRAVVGLEHESGDPRTRPVYLLASKIDGTWKLIGGCSHLDAALCYVADGLPAQGGSAIEGTVTRITEALTRHDETALKAHFLPRAWTGEPGGERILSRLRSNRLRPAITQVLTRLPAAKGAEPSGWAVALELKSEGRTVARYYLLFVEADKAPKVALALYHRDSELAASFLRRTFRPEMDLARLPVSPEIRKLGDQLLALVEKDGQLEADKLLRGGQELKQAAWSQLRGRVQQGLKPRVVRARANRLFRKGVFTVEWRTSAGNRLVHSQTLECARFSDGWRVTGASANKLATRIWLTSVRRAPAGGAGSGRER